MANKSANIEIHVTTNLERALKQFKKQSERQGIVRDMKRTVYYEPPTQKRRKRLMRAIKQALLRRAANPSN